MPKKIKFESFKNHFLVVASNYDFKSKDDVSWKDFLNNLEFIYDKHSGFFNIKNKSGLIFNFDPGPLLLYGKKNKNFDISNFEIDFNKTHNFEIINNLVLDVAKLSNYSSTKDLSQKRLDDEEVFHDEWAESESSENIDVILCNESITSPEMRYITQKLGNLKGKKILDMGCGLGEASIYFALKGAEVTACDISPKMLDKVTDLAKKYNVEVNTHVSSFEKFHYYQSEFFDIIYVGNCLHHVDIYSSINEIKIYLKKGGIFVSWDPVHYNPVINIYRKMAMKVRTIDEKPLKLKDINFIKKNFTKSETKYFWLTTLIIFVMMYFFQKKDPNKIRYWKNIVYEGEKWKWLYIPLSLLDKFFYVIFPPLRLLSWNVVIYCKK